MRKSYVKILTFGAAVALCAMASNADAKVTGRCDNCHTMHNSQNGATWVGNTATPNAFLTIGTCAGCHTGDGSAKLVPITLAPAVVVTGSNPTQSSHLPGGYISMATGELDSWKHNVLSVEVGKDPAMPNFAPPGYDPPSNTGATGLPATAADWTQLTCAGNMGCHGDHNKAEGLAVAGGHHNDTAIGFRLLAGIHGVEGTTYTVGEGVGGEATNQDNVYDGISAQASAYGNKTTISYLCAECHGIFHKTSETGSATPWLRHPTDFQLPGSRPDAYTDYGTADRPYSADAPVGMDLGAVTRLSGAGVAPLPAAGQGSVLCISCHRAHGSDQPDLLRWDYNGMNAGSNPPEADTGCFYCHTNKD